MKQKLATVLGGMATINASALYGLFRIGTVFVSFQADSNPFDRTIITLFFLSEGFIIVNSIGYFINIISATTNYERPSPQLTDKRKKWPRVTVFIPMRNEMIDVVRKTFIACSYLDYPKLDIVVVDSSDEKAHQQAIKREAETYGLTYFMTPYPRHGAKAGALNEALQKFDTPYFVVFDADYHPSRDFIKRLVPQMEQDPKLAYIQTPQFYGNLVDSLVSRISQIQQSIFYEFIAEGKSSHDSMFMCGTNLIMRRKALESVGWWDEKSITEDFSTSIELIKKGWRSRYYNHTMAFGMGPINLATYLNQQYRWARGTFGAYFKNIGAIHNPFSPLSFFQRLEYSLSGIYFLVGLVWSFLIMMPVFYIFFRIPAYTSDPLLFTVAYMPYMILSFAFFGTTMHYRKFRIRDLLKAQSLTLITLPAYVKAFFHALFGYKATFITTKKSGSPYDIPWENVKIQLIMIGLNIIAVPIGLATYPSATNKTALLTNIAWATFHSIILLYFLGSLYAAQQKNRA